MAKIHKPVVAGTFYPEDPSLLKQMLRQFLSSAPAHEKPPKAIIAPHAGYIYSGSIASSVYVRLHSVKHKIKKVLLIGPSHRVGFQGLALSTADQFLTPLGAIAIDTLAVKKIAEYPYAQFLDQAYEQEHCLEVHLPFLQTVLDSFSLIPVIVGNASAEQICELIALFWDEPDTFTVISSDLSHFLDYGEAQIKDKKTSELIEQLDYTKLDNNSACGRIPISGLLALAKKYNLQVKTVDLRNSGDTAGSKGKNKVVGYGAYVIE